MRDMEKLLGADLLWRVRRGRILLKGRWIHFPLKPVDLLLRLPPSFALSIVRDIALKPLLRQRGGEETFESILRRAWARRSARSFTSPTHGSSGASSRKTWPRRLLAVGFRAVRSARSSRRLPARFRVSSPRPREGSTTRAAGTARSPNATPRPPRRSGLNTLCRHVSAPSRPRGAE